MGRFRVELTSQLSAQEAFRRITTLDAHTAVVPFTTLRHDGRLGIGSNFTARTSLGPVGFDDPMIVREYAEPGDKPGKAVFVKTGRWVSGQIEFTATPRADGAQLVWQQDIAIPWLPRILDPVVTAVARAAYARTLRQLLDRA
jgi:hypothetical protein